MTNISFSTRNLFSEGIGKIIIRNAGNHTLETRVKNIKLGNYAIRLNDRQSIKAAAAAP